MEQARRRFLTAVPAAVAGGLAAPALARQTQEPAIGKDTLECAEKVIGIDFSAAEQEQALTGVNRSLQRFQQLRQVDIPLDTEPAVTFRPYLPGKAPKPGATPHARIKVALKTRTARGSTLDELAFLPITALAPLLQRREVSATELTRMYLARLENLTGHPALALRAGFHDNAPVELMITGRLYDEATLLAVGLAYERATTWHEVTPTLAS